MRIMIPLIAAMLLVVGAASASIDNWQVQCGLGDNVPGCGNDFLTVFGVSPGGTYTLDGDDANHPTIANVETDLGFIYNKNYYKIYRDQILHPAGIFSWTAPVGWPPAWGGHGDGTLPEWTAPGLIKDNRAPVTVAGQPEIWQVTLSAPQETKTCSFIWNWNSAAGYEVPDNMEIKIWGNSDLEAIGIYGDFVLSDKGNGIHKLTGIPQWGLNDEGESIKHTWVIQATLVPEPAVAQLAGLVLGIAGLGIARFRRK